MQINIKLFRIFLWGLALVTCYLIITPSLYLLIWAFWGTDVVGVLEPTFSIRWFVNLLSDPDWQWSLFYSTVVGGIVSFIGCLTLLNHFYFTTYISSMVDKVSYLIMLLVVLVPAVIYGLSLRLIGGKLGIPEIILLSIGHLVLVVPIQYFIFESRRESISPKLLYAANTMGASHWRTMLYVYLPLMNGAIKGAFIIGFFVSFDELIISNFVLDSTFITVPKRLWNEVDQNMDPTPAVVTILLMIFAGLVNLVWFALILGGRLIKEKE